MRREAIGGPSAVVIPAGRWRAMRIFVAVGIGAVVIGGIIAAITGPTGFARGSWLAAYLVLVVGVAQTGLGAGQGIFADRPPPTQVWAWQLIGYNAANAAVIVGTIVGSVPVVVGGGLVLLAALASFLVAVRRAAGPPVALLFYRGLVALLAVSIPIGVALSATRLG